MEKSKRNKISTEILPSLKELQFSESIKNKLYSNAEKRTDQNKTSCVDKNKAKKVLIKVHEHPKPSNLNFNTNSDLLKLHNNSHVSFASIGKKKNKKAILKAKPNKKVKFIKNEEIEKKILKFQETKQLNHELIIDDNLNQKKIDFFDEANEEFIMSIDSDESNENDEKFPSFSSNREESCYEHAIRFHIPSPRYTMLMNEIEYYKNKVYLLQQENSNMHLKISILEDKLMEKTSYRFKNKVPVIHEDKEMEVNATTEVFSDLKIKKKHNKHKKTNSFVVDAMPPVSIPLVSNIPKEKKNENFIENYENFMKNLQKKINETENVLQNEKSNNDTQKEQVNISYLFKTPTNSGNQKNSRNNSPLVFTNEAFATPRRDSPSNKGLVNNNKSTEETSELKNSIKLPILLKGKPQLASYTYEDIQNEELEELKRKINDDLFF